MAVRIETLALGPLETNCHVVAAGGECWVVDPSLWPGPLLGLLDRLDLRVRRVLLTHGHGDHIGGVAEVLAAFPDATLTCPAGDMDMLADAEANFSRSLGMPIRVDAPAEGVSPGETLQLADTSWQVLDTSGHTPGGVSYYCAAAPAAITGDALFAGSIGRTDIPGGDTARLLANIREHLLTLPDETRVLPGHGPETTIGAERRGNPFLQG